MSWIYLFSKCQLGMLGLVYNMYFPTRFHHHIQDPSKFPTCLFIDLRTDQVTPLLPPMISSSFWFRNNHNRLSELAKNTDVKISFAFSAYKYLWINFQEDEREMGGTLSLRCSVTVHHLVMYFWCVYPWYPWCMYLWWGRFDDTAAGAVGGLVTFQFELEMVILAEFISSSVQN